MVPGVGAFGDCMDELERRALIEPILDYRRHRPAAARHLRRHADVHADRRGVRRACRARPDPRARARHSAAPRRDGRPHKIPHIGWNALRRPNSGADWTGTILDGIEPGSTCYFVHSFTAEPEDARYRLADCDYNGRRISAALRVGNVYGTQFHPEKSGERGLRILRNFLALERAAAGADRLAV